MEFMKLIFVVEDHDVIRNGVKSYLEMSGYNVLTFSNITDAKEAIETKLPSLLIQDVMLPDGNGFDFVAEIKKKYDVPVVFLTARISEEDRIRGLELGADDYIVKPFSPRELVLRVGAILKRTDSSNTIKDEQPSYLFKNENSSLYIDCRKHTAEIDGERIQLTNAEFKILEILAKNSSTVARSTILKDCFGYTSSSYNRIVDTHVKNLRAKLGKSDWIETIRGIGYRFTGIAQEESK